MESKAKIISTRRKIDLVECRLVTCPTCLTRFKVRNVMPVVGLAYECPCCHQRVWVTERNSRSLEVVEHERA